ncbi:hypothetical protein WOLCODRAFT_107631 [Wolfiporia cocos MD-104 SS10]|uniref:Uncharacterized protein n=1 Tax=Wolfiporia cocos (strain MD-104) TaxID=742152 RepID=A0A2H3JD85_WOLCO|nr:hypothetical protein WOLCODRAFT_107631 [Wolfiporia cocos MD-104 SS10]
MIVGKRALPDDATPAEAPPAYDALVDVPAATFSADAKVDTPPNFSLSAPTSPSLSLRTFPRPPKQEPGEYVSWFPFGQRARAARGVRTTVTSILRDIVKQPGISDSAPSILASCADACRAHGLSIASLLQDPCMEGHTAIYWAVVKRAPEAEAPLAPESDLVNMLLAMAAPLTPTTMSDIRLACLQNADQALFQRLRRSPVFSPPSGTEDLLLSGEVIQDEIEVEDVPDDDAAFVVRFRIPMFQKRLRVSKQINLEFIARGRLWSLKFLVAAANNIHLRPIATPGTWIVTLSLLEHSPPTWVDSRLLIEDASAAAATASAFPGRPSSRPKPTIALRLKTGAAQLVADRSADQLIAASFKDTSAANSLTYQGSPYISADNSLQARLEARLGKPDTECIIC